MKTNDILPDLDSLYRVPCYFWDSENRWHWVGEPSHLRDTSDAPRAAMVVIPPGCRWDDWADFGGRELAKLVFPNGRTVSAHQLMGMTRRQGVTIEWDRRGA